MHKMPKLLPAMCGCIIKELYFRFADQRTTSNNEIITCGSCPDNMYIYVHRT